MSSISQVQKRNGAIAPFDAEKVTTAIYRAAQSVGGRDKAIARQLSQKVIQELEVTFTSSIPTVEQVQDTVEKVLIKEGHAKTAKSYILYRNEHAALRREKMLVLEKEDSDEVDKAFDLNALRVLKARYLRKDEQGKLIETPKQLFTRVAVHAALPEILYDSHVFDISGTQPQHESIEVDFAANNGRYAIGAYKLNQYHLEAVKSMWERANKQGRMKVAFSQLLSLMEEGKLNTHEKTINDFYNAMVTRKFMPNTPAIANFGNVLGMGSACFVIDIEDSIDDIMEKLKQTAIVFKAGGGMGYNFSKLRPEGDFVASTGGVASGPMSFMRLFDTMTEVIKQGGIRRGANMGILNSNHPDIEKFITIKAGNKAMRNFNISVLIMPDFWEHYEQNKPYPLLNPRTGQVVKHVNPRELFDRIVYQAWESAEPGVIFFDKVNKYNPFFKHLGPIVTTNPCVVAETMISTERGLERIDAIKAEKITVDARLLESGTGSQQLLQLGTQLVKPAQVVKTGIKETFKLTTKSGYELTATEDHQIMTTHGWKMLKDITSEDKVFIQSGAGAFATDKRLPFTVQNTHVGENGRTYKTDLPEEWSEELGFVLGWLVGDGFISEAHNTVGLVFAPEDAEAEAILKPVFERYCNRNILPAAYANGCIQLRSNSRYITEFFLRLGYNPKERAVPASLYTAPREAVLGFLSGLFSSDGTIGMGTRSRNYARLNSSSLRLLKDVQLLLLNLGIRSVIYDRSTKPKLFFYENKDGEPVTYQTSGKNYELNISKRNLSAFIALVQFFQERQKRKIRALSQFEFYQERFLERVHSVACVGEREVWDITEPRTQSFIANGIVVHNCGEVLLYGNESCNLGSINVWAFAQEDERGNVTVDWEGMKKTIMTCTKLLDNVIDVNKFPLKAIEDMTLATRKIGLGVMGVADLLYELSLPYNTEEGRAFMERLMEFINYYSKVESIELAKERGPMPYNDKSFYPEGMLPIAGFLDRKSWHFDWDKLSADFRKHGSRNGYTTVIAPTGSISMIAGTSSGIEPVYALAFEKNVKVGSFFYVDPVFEKVLRKEGLYSEALMEKVIMNKGGIADIPEIPEHLKKIFKIALDTTPEEHIRALGTFQKWTDSSISKTNNFPADATVEDMRQSYILAYKLGCKDVTVFRDTSIKEQVLVSGKTKTEHKNVEPQRIATMQEAPKIEQPKKLMAVATTEGIALETNGNGNGHAPNFRGKPTTCPECKVSLKIEEGCVTCPQCGWGLCM